MDDGSPVARSGAAPGARPERRLNRDPVTLGDVSWPSLEPLEGERVRLVSVDPAAHLESLFALSHGAAETEALWTYMPYGPFGDRAAMAAWLEGCAGAKDPRFVAVYDKARERASGMASFLNINPAHGSIEIGHIWFAPPLQRTPAATEALFLMMRHAFDELGNRRLEWKCNALNEASRRAALRLGFRFEGVFHQHMVVKSLNRDTAWFSILDHEWPSLRANFEAWLAPENFDAEGRQKQSLSALNATAERR